jgi:hypothetical protein
LAFHRVPPGVVEHLKLAELMMDEIQADVEADLMGIRIVLLIAALKLPTLLALFCSASFLFLGFRRIEKLTSTLRKGLDYNYGQCRADQSLI